jgi:2'-5' RNA ligase
VTEPTQLTALTDPESVLFELVDERPAMTLEEAYAFLTGADTNTFGVPPIIVAAAEVHTGAMIALVPTDVDAARLAVPAGESNDQLHVTLAYLGEADDIAPNARRKLVERLEAALGKRGDVIGEGFAVSVFNPPGHVKDDGKDRDACIVLGLSGHELQQVHDTVKGVVSEVQSTSPGLQIPEQHTPWIPHITLVYTDDVARVASLTNRAEPVKFDRLFRETDLLVIP